MRTKLLIVIICIAAAFRFIGLGTNPPALNWDEIAIGWNAYSLLKTGKDEFGTSFPLTFRSFDDYKSPAYIYAVIPSLILFGKSEFAVRFPSALLGTLSIIGIYLLTKRIVYKSIADGNQQGVWNNRTDNIAIIAAGLLAITPWHVHFSRVAFEANFALFWEVVGGYLFLKWVQSDITSDRKKQLAFGIGSVVSFAVALYSYANARLFIVLLLAGWVVIMRLSIWKKKKQGIVMGIIGIVLAVPLLMQMLQGVGLARFQATSIINRPEMYERNKMLAVEDFTRGEGLLSVIVHNQKVAIVRQIVQNYTDHYLYSFLFIKADLPRHQIPGFGLLYPWQLPLIVIGTVFLIKNHKYRTFSLLLWWLLVAPLPAALTWQVPHAIRSELMLPPLTIISGIGLWAVLKYIQQLDLHSYTRGDTTNKLVMQSKWLLPKIAFIGLVGIIGMSAYALAFNYHNSLPKEFAQNWLYGRKEMVQIVEKEKESFDVIIVDLQVEWAYLWFLWYGNYTPEWYLAQGGTVSGGFEEERNRIGKIEFKKFPFESIHYGSQKVPTKGLFIGLPNQFPKELIPYRQVIDPGGKSAIYIVKT